MKDLNHRLLLLTSFAMLILSIVLLANQPGKADESSVGTFQISCARDYDVAACVTINTQTGAVVSKTTFGD